MATKRWFPGHYVQAFDQQSRTTLVESERLLVSSNDNFKGYQIAVWWDQIEPSFGVYDFTEVLEALDRADSTGKKCWIRFIDRAFQGFQFGRPFPTYLDNAPYGWYIDGGTMVAPKLWETSTGERWLLAWEALITACDSHPACQGFTTEEYEAQGAYTQHGPSGIILMDAFWLEASRRGNLKAVNSLIHINTGYAYSRTRASLYTISSQMVSHCSGLGPTDIIRTYIGPGAPQPAESTAFGTYIFKDPSEGHRGETFFKMSYEWGAYDGTDSPSSIIDYAHETYRCQFITWDPDRTSGGNYSWSTVLSAVNSSSGKIWSTKPTNVVAYDNQTTEPPVIYDPIPVPQVGSWFAKLSGGLNTWTTRAASAPSPGTAGRPRRIRFQ